jgi:hypothetical protein
LASPSERRDAARRRGRRRQVQRARAPAAGGGAARGCGRGARGYGRAGARTGSGAARQEQRRPAAARPRHVVRRGARAREYEGYHGQGPRGFAFRCDQQQQQQQKEQSALGDFDDEEEDGGGGLRGASNSAVGVPLVVRFDAARVSFARLRAGVLRVLLLLATGEDPASQLGPDWEAALAPRARALHLNCTDYLGLDLVDEEPLGAHPPAHVLPDGDQLVQDGPPGLATRRTIFLAALWPTQEEQEPLEPRGRDTKSRRSRRRVRAARPGLSGVAPYGNVGPGPRRGWVQRLSLLLSASS